MTVVVIEDSIIAVEDEGRFVAAFDSEGMSNTLYYHVEDGYQVHVRSDNGFDEELAVEVIDGVINVDTWFNDIVDEGDKLIAQVAEAYALRRTK